MQKRWTWMILILISLTVLWGCSDDDDPVTPAKSAFQTMAEAGKAYISDDTALTGCPGVIDADAVSGNLALYTVIDIRREADYVKGHIPGAYNSSLGTLLDDLGSGAIPDDKPFVIACYSGQSAGHAKIAMELLGYEVYSLLFGMSSWNPETRYPWDGATIDASMADRNVLANPEQTNNNGDLTAHDFPVLTGDANTIVRTQVETMLDDGFKSIDYAGLLALPEAFVLNYFGVADYEGTGTSGVPGHISGAFQYTPYTSMGWDEMLPNIPTDIPVVVYCWTGQHSSQITAYLNMLGYDAYSLTYGSNKLFYDDLTAHKWTTGAYNDYPLETGSTPTPAFAAVAAAGKAYISDNTPVSGCPGTVDADAIAGNPALYQVIDFRSETDFNLGHVSGAVHSELSTLVTDLTDGTIPTGKPYVVTCYSGQRAGHAKIAMEMLGYEVYTMLFGMSAWNPATRGPWDDATINAAVPDRNVLTNPEQTNNNDDLDGYAFPAIAGDAATAVETAVESMLTDGFKGIDYAGLMALPEVFIVNYFGVNDYEGNGTDGVPGHIPGAFQYTPFASMGWDEMLHNIPSDIPVVVYCWTGQHSSQITAYLNMLGYDAYSLTYGSNKLFYDDLTAHKWTVGAYNDHPLVTK